MSPIGLRFSGRDVSFVGLGSHARSVSLQMGGTVPAMFFLQSASSPGFTLLATSTEHSAAELTTPLLAALLSA